jgi:hypothetical protein
MLFLLSFKSGLPCSCNLCGLLLSELPYSHLRLQETKCNTLATSSVLISDEERADESVSVN